MRVREGVGRGNREREKRRGEGRGWGGLKMARAMVGEEELLTGGRRIKEEREEGKCRGQKKREGKR